MGVSNEWNEVELGNVTKIIAGQAPHSSSYNQEKKGMPFLRVNSFGKKYPETDYWTTTPLKVCDKEDILLSVAGTIGNVNISDKIDHLLKHGFTSVDECLSTCMVTGSSINESPSLSLPSNISSLTP